ICCGIAGLCLALIYLVPPNDVPTTGQNMGFVPALLCIGGLFLGYAVALVIFGLVSRRFLSRTTHERWAEYLNDPAVSIRVRFGGLVNLIRWAMLPREYRALSNNRSRVP